MTAESVARMLAEQRDRSATEIDRHIKHTFALVECDSYSRLRLHFEAKANGFQVEQIGIGTLVEVGRLVNMPVSLDLSWDRIQGLLVCFWDSPSTVSDHRLIEAWFKANMPNVVARRDAMNFHIVLQAVEDAAGGRLADRCEKAPCPHCSGFRCTGKRVRT